MRQLAVLLLGLTLALNACGRPDPIETLSPSPGKTEIQTSKPSLSPTLRSVRKRGYLICGVNPGLAGFAILTPEGTGVALM
ncbi:MAG: hypothetical protein CGW95_08610 [Phenylobacterium zucineum]|nr:MAG: hypothetical protein CGW95_08610 [Phenylobacterium zucineum]